MSRASYRPFLVGLFLAVLVIGAVVSQFSSSDPDGLEYVAEREGLSATATDHAVADGPLADYGANLPGDARLNRAVAGVVGVVASLTIGLGLFWLVRRRTPDDGSPARSL